jgi:hypothetical protein
MDKKMKECFEPHVLMHSLFGLGLGLLLVYFVPSLNIVWLGPLLMVVSVAMDMMRK